MGKMELEVKVLNINEEQIIKKIEDLGGKFINKYNQYLYTYDLPTVYGRYFDILLVLNETKSEVKRETEMERLKLLFFEIDNLLTEEDKIEIKNIIGKDNFTSLLEIENVLNILNDEKLIAFITKMHNNSKKWIRLRKSNEKTTLTVKHILANNGSKIQQMLETEIEVPSMKEANDLLEALGYAHKSYQEKRRISYLLNGYEIDIDTWPGLPTYMEIEGTDEEDLNNILKILGYRMEDTISCTVDEVYKKYGVDILNIRELKF